MFGLDRRPEPDTKRDHGVTGMELMIEAVSAPSVLVKDHAHITEVRRAFDQVFRGGRSLRSGRSDDDRDLLHAAVQIADLWAFETGRLP